MSDNGKIVKKGNFVQMRTFEEYTTLNMDNKEAIEILKMIKRGYLPDYCFTYTEEDYENYKRHVAIGKAINALERIEE